MLVIALTVLALALVGVTLLARQAMWDINHVPSCRTCRTGGNCRKS